MCFLARSGRSKSSFPRHAHSNRRTAPPQPHLHSPSHTRSRLPNPHARRKPIPIGRSRWLSPRSCIGNAPAIRPLSGTPTPLGRRTPDTTHMTYNAYGLHMTYNAYDFPPEVCHRVDDTPLDQCREIVAAGRRWTARSLISHKGTWGPREAPPVSPHASAAILQGGETSRCASNGMLERLPRMCGNTVSRLMKPQACFSIPFRQRAMIRIIRSTKGAS